jgi:5-methylcytosine-specific restriction endonuclease McrA
MYKHIAFCLRREAMLFMLDPDIANIQVYDKDDRLLAPCSYKKADKLVKRKSAEWIDYNQIKLLVNKDDTRKLRKEIEIESKRICYICGSVIPEDTPITLDHVLPKSEGGPDSKSNIRCACKRCNDDKKNRTIHDYIKHISRYRQNYDYICEERLEALKIFAKEFNM